MHRYRISFALILTALLFNAELVKSFKITDPKFHRVRRGNTDATKTNGKSSESDMIFLETLLGNNNLNYTIPNEDVELEPVEGELDMEPEPMGPRDLYYSPSTHPIFYTADTSNVLSYENRLPEPYPIENLYNPYQYYPPTQSLPTAGDGYSAENYPYPPTSLFNHHYLPPLVAPIPLIPAAPISNLTPTGTKVTTKAPPKMETAAPKNRTEDHGVPSEVPQIKGPINSNNAHAYSAIEDFMMKKIQEIVNEFNASNAAWRSDNSSTNNTFSLRKQLPTIVATTSIDENNRTTIESTIGFDETRTEIRTDGNRTVTSEIARGPVNQPSVSPVITETSTVIAPTMGPNRYLIEQFLDQNGNPCMKELVTTSQRKMYHVYTCEEKGIPRTPKTLTKVSVYRNELKNFNATTESQADYDVTTDTNIDEPETTTPMTIDQTLPTALNDYAIFNMQ